MRFFNTIIIAIRALRRNKLRSMLTALGIIIGVGAVIATVSIGNGAKSQVEAQVASLGQNIITVFPGSMTTGGMRGGFGTASTLTTDDAEAIQREIGGIVATGPQVSDRQQVLANGLNWNTSITGQSPDFLSIRNWSIAEGSMFTEQDVRSAAKVAVIGQTIADQLFPGADPIGQSVRIRNIPFTILGILNKKGFNTFGQDQDDVILIPYTTAMRRVTRRDRLQQIIVQARQRQPDDAHSGGYHRPSHAAPPRPRSGLHRSQSARNRRGGHRNVEDHDPAPQRDCRACLSSSAASAS
jgi:putative ABC transport system permease protein